MTRQTALSIAQIKDPTARARAQFGAPSGTREDRIAHQSVWKYRDNGSGQISPGYASHKAWCSVCQDLDAGGDGLGGRS